MKLNKYAGPAMLLLTAMVWGAAFVAQSVGLNYVGPFTLNSVRFLLAGVFLLPCIALLRRAGFRPQTTGKPRDLVLGSLVCGGLLTVASSLQQLGVAHTTVSKAGFITALYVILVPILGLFLGKKVRPLVWFCVALSVVGLYLLCMAGPASIGSGDLLVLLCALVYALHILAIDYFSRRVDTLVLSCIQFLICGALCALPMLALEHPAPGAILAAWKPILYAGILSSGVGYTLQAVAQRRTDPTVASLILCMESVFSALFGWILLHQSLSPRELTGCGLMLAAILLAQLPARQSQPGEASPRPDPAEQT